MVPICLNYKRFSKRRKLIGNQQLNNSLITSTIEARKENLTIKKYLKIDVYNSIINNITNRMKTKFSDESLIWQNQLIMFLNLILMVH